MSDENYGAYSKETVDSLRGLGKPRNQWTKVGDSEWTLDRLPDETDAEYAARKATAGKPSD